MESKSKARLRLVGATSPTNSDLPDLTLRIAILGLPKAALSDIAGPYEAFLHAARLAQERAGPLQKRYEVSLLSIEGTSISTLSGLRLEGACPLAEYEGFPDTLIVAGEPHSLDESHERSQLLNWIQTAAERCRRICSICTGAFCLAEAGVLDGRQAATHWRHADALARRYPRVQVDPQSLFLRDGKFYTSAGCMAAMDVSLALIEDDLGAEIAAEIASDSLMYLRRPGRHAQVSPLLKLQMSDREPMRNLQTWMLEHLHLPLTVEDLAREVHMSPRNFARAFVDLTGTTPARFLETLRLEAARRQLEETSRGLDEIASACGFGSAEVMRRAFLRNFGTPPGEYRQRLA